MSHDHENILAITSRDSSLVQLQVLYRDLKPENCLLDDDAWIESGGYEILALCIIQLNALGVPRALGPQEGHIRLTDFGLSKESHCLCANGPWDGRLECNVRVYYDAWAIVFSIFFQCSRIRGHQNWHLPEALVFCPGQSHPFQTLHVLRASFFFFRPMWPGKKHRWLRWALLDTWVQRWWLDRATDYRWTTIVWVAGGHRTHRTAECLTFFGEMWMAPELLGNIDPDHIGYPNPSRSVVLPSDWITSSLWGWLQGGCSHDVSGDWTFLHFDRF